MWKETPAMSFCIGIVLKFFCYAYYQIFQRLADATNFIERRSRSILREKTLAGKRRGTKSIHKLLLIVLAVVMFMSCVTPLGGIYAAPVPPVALTDPNETPPITPDPPAGEGHDDDDPSDNVIFLPGPPPPIPSGSLFIDYNSGLEKKIVVTGPLVPVSSEKAKWRKCSGAMSRRRR